MGVFGGGESAGVVGGARRRPEVGAAYQNLVPACSRRGEIGAGALFGGRGHVEG